MIYRLTHAVKHLNAIYKRVAPLAGSDGEELPLRQRMEYRRQIAEANALYNQIESLWDALPVPERQAKSNRRGRFWFTESGWKRFGLPYLCALRRAGASPQVLCQKNPKRSTIYFRDKWQVILL